jgi:hypothetical protein
MDDEEVHQNGLGHGRYGEESKTVQIAQVVAAATPNPPPLEPIQSNLSETGTINERPIAFGPLWKEILIVLLCTCGPMVQVSSVPLLFFQFPTLYTTFYS